jgi:hypothetical protein
MAKTKTKHFMIVWRTTTSKYQFVSGPTVEDACNQAGIGGGAVGAIDYYSDITAFVNSAAMQKALREVVGYGEHGYYWKRETCAKLARLGCKDVLVDHVDAHGDKGWKIGPAGVAMLDHYCKERSE